MNTQNTFFIKQFVWSYSLLFLGLMISCFLACFSTYTNCIFSFIIYFPFPTLLILSTMFITNGIMSISKKGIKKGWIIVVSIFLFIFKYIFAVSPILIGILINVSCGNEIFNLISLIVVVLIYPSSSLLSQISLTKKNNNARL